MKTPKAFGWEVVVQIRTGIISSEEKTFHWRGVSAATARARAMLKTGAIAVVGMRQLTERQWQIAYGIGRL